MILSCGTLTDFAFSINERSRGLVLGFGSGWAAITIAFKIFEKTAPFLASCAPLRCLI